MNKPRTKAEWILYREKPRWTRAPFRFHATYRNGKEVYEVRDVNDAVWMRRKRAETAHKWVELWNEEAATKLMAR